MEVNSLQCCGIKEISGLVHERDAKVAARTFCNIIYRRDNTGVIFGGAFRYVVFAQAKDRLYGEEFSAFILENKLGEVIATGTHVNPNSSNQLKVWMWTVDHVALKKWWGSQ